MVTNISTTSTTKKPAKWYKPWLAELKVIAMTGVVAVMGGAGAVLNAMNSDSSLLGGMPTWLQSLILVIAPTGGAYLVGWSTKHTPRNNEDATRGTD